MTYETSLICTRNFSIVTKHKPNVSKADCFKTLCVFVFVFSDNGKSPGNIWNVSRGKPLSQDYMILFNKGLVTELRIISKLCYENEAWGYNLDSCGLRQNPVVCCCENGDETSGSVKMVGISSANDILLSSEVRFCSKVQSNPLL
jgi:hypothetical protein